MTSTLPHKEDGMCFSPAASCRGISRVYHCLIYEQGRNSFRVKIWSLHHYVDLNPLLSSIVSEKILLPPQCKWLPSKSHSFFWWWKVVTKQDKGTQEAMSEVRMNKESCTMGLERLYSCWEWILVWQRTQVQVPALISQLTTASNSNSSNLVLSFSFLRNMPTYYIHK